MKKILIISLILSSGLLCSTAFAADSIDATASYTKTKATQTATINSDGAWTVDGIGTFSHAPAKAKTALYLIGADVDGDATSDAVYITKPALAETTKVYVKRDPLGNATETFSFRGGKGNLFSFYSDADGNGTDEICFLKQIGKSQKFKAVCKNALTGAKVGSAIKLGKVYGRPFPVRQESGADHFGFKSNSSGSIKVVNVAGETVEENSSATAPDAYAGVFKSTLLKYLCTSKDIRKKGYCPMKVSGCDVYKANSDGPLGGFLWKPASDHVNAPVTLLPKGTHASSCSYLKATGKQFTGGHTSGYANGLRQHWRPNGNPSCGRFPEPSIFKCRVGSKDHCYLIPDPCNRYD